MPLITGNWASLQQSDYEQLHPSGSPLHFTKPASRTKIDSLVATFGWPLIGIFVSGSGGPDGIPDWIMHRSEFPLAPIHAAPTVTVQGQTGSTTWGYKVVPRSAAGLIVGATGPETRITNGRATQNAQNGNNISWPAVSGAATYEVFLTVGPLALGRIASVATTTYQHRGAVGNGTAPLVIDQRTAVADAMDEAATTLYRNASGDRSFWVRSHFWTYKADRSYVPGGSADGDYVFTVAEGDVPANWWSTL